MVAATAQARLSKSTNPIIVDADVHELIKPQQLVPYLSPHWQRYITDYGFSGPPDPLPYGPVGRRRLDRVPEGGEMGSDLGLMRKQLFEDQGTTVAILNCAELQFSTMESRY